MEIERAHAERGGGLAKRCMTIFRRWEVAQETPSAELEAPQPSLCRKRRVRPIIRQTIAADNRGKAVPQSEFETALMLVSALLHWEVHRRHAQGAPGILVAAESASGRSIRKLGPVGPVGSV